MGVGSTLVQALAVAEIFLGVALAARLWRRPVAWIALFVNLTSTVGSWRDILDPWGLWGLGNGGTHLFLASVLLTAVSVVLVLEANVGSDRERNVVKATQRGATWPALNTVLIAVSNGWRRAPEWHPVVRARPGSAIT